MSRETLAVLLSIGALVAVGGLSQTLFGDEPSEYRDGVALLVVVTAAVGVYGAIRLARRMKP